MEKSYSASYAAAGVDITAGYEGVKLMSADVNRTHIPGVVSDIGGFGGLFAPDLTGMTITGATKILVDRGLNIILEGATQAYTTGSYAVAISQSIPPYTKVTPGTVVTVEFRFTDARDG